MKKIVLLSLFVLSGCSEYAPPNFKNLTTVALPEATAPPPEAYSNGRKTIRNLELKNFQVIRLLGEVGYSTEDYIHKLDKLNQDKNISEIYLLIDSPGGSVLGGAKFISAIEASKKPVFTVCTGMCASMAAIIHQYGTKRLMLDRSILMFHDAAGALQGSFPQMLSRFNFLNRYVLKMNAYVAKRAGVDFESFVSALHTETWLDSEDSTARHFNDEIVYITVEGEDSNPFSFIPTNKFIIMDDHVQH